MTTPLIHIKAYCSVNTMNFAVVMKLIVKVCSYKNEECTSGATTWSWEYKWLKYKSDKSLHFVTVNNSTVGQGYKNNDNSCNILSLLSHTLSVLI